MTTFYTDISFENNENVDDYLSSLPTYDKVRSFYPSNHNTSPLTLFPQKHIESYFTTFDKKLLNAKVVKDGVEMISRLIMTSNLSTEYTISVDASPVYYYLFTEALDRDIRLITNTKGMTNSIMCIKAGLKCLEVEVRGLTNHHPGLDPAMLEHVASLYLEVDVFNKILNSYILRDLLDTYKQRMQLAIVEGSGKSVKATIGDLHFLCKETVIVCWFANSEAELRLLNYDQYIMILDTIISRSCSMTACLVNDKIGKNLLPTLNELTSIYRWGDELICRYGYDAYAAIGEFESLVTCKMIRYGNSDPLELGEDYEQSIYDNAKEMELEYSIEDDWVDDLFELLDKIQTINKLSEIFGIRKHWGNPILDASASGAAVQQKAKEHYPIDSDAMLMLLASFQRMVILEYIRKEGHWPKCVVLDGYQKTPLAVACQSGSVRINEHHKDHKYEHWAGIRFKQNVIVDKCLNPLDLLSDKSCSLYRSNLDSIYVYGYRTDENKGSPLPVESRRLLLEYMRRDHLTIEEIFKIVQSNMIPKEWLVNLCALKGTEMKHRKGRIFAVLPYELRQYFSATEDLIKQYIFPYNPHQTMTMKEDQLVRLLADITGQLNPDSTSRDLHVVHIIDFSKWNLRMSEENTSPIFRSIDDFLGKPNLIEATHHIFDLMLNVVQDPFNPPKLGVLLTFIATIWDMHNRGWEGQRQRGWTALTSALLALLEFLTGVQSKILGQGDNQILASKFRVPDEYKNAADWIARDGKGVKKILDNFYSVLVDECLKIGLPVKKSETCRSLVFCNYGKRLYQYGVELSMELKRLSRIATESNDSFPTTDSLLKTMTSSAAASPIYGPPSITSLIVSHINVAITLHKAITCNPLVPKEVELRFAQLSSRLTSDLLAKIMWFPASLGGPHRTMLFGSMFRGHPDPIAADYATIVLAARAGSTYHKKLLEYIIRLDAPTDDIDIRGLIVSPYSINLKIPHNPLRPMLNAVNEKLKSYCRNSEVAPLFSDICDDQDKLISDTLDTLTPFHPVIANEIFSRSLPGRKEAFLGGFKNTTSFAQLLHQTGESLKRKIGIFECQQVVWWASIALQINGLSYSEGTEFKAHHIILHELRERTWGRRLEGVTVPHPSEAITLTVSNFGVCSELCSGLSKDRIDLILIDEDRVGIDSEEIRSRLTERVPNRMGYLGNTVSEGMICKTMRATNRSTALEDAMRLNVLRRWVTERESYLDKFIKLLIKQRTNVSLSELNELTGIPVRLSYTHRVSSVATKKKCSVSCNTNIHSQIYLSSNNMGELNRTDENVSFVFGQSFLFCQHLIGINEFYGNEQNYRGKVCYHGHVTDSKTIVSVYDGPINLKYKFARNHSFVRPACKMLYIERKHLDLDVRGNRVFPRIWRTPETSDLKFCRLAYGVQAVGDSIIQAERIKSLLNIHGISVAHKREAPITASDILSVGVDSYLQAIALCLLLTIPFDVIFNQVVHDHSMCGLSEFVDKVGQEAWSSLFSPLIIPRVLAQLIPLLPNYRSNRFGTTVQSITYPVQTVILNKIGDLILEQQQLLIRYHRSPNSGMYSTITIFSDGLRSTAFLMSRYLELNAAILIATLGSVSSIEGALSIREKVHVLYKVGDNCEALETTMRRLFIDYQVQFYGQSIALQQFPLPVPIYADLNLCWGAEVRHHNPVASTIALLSKESLNKESYPDFFAHNIKTFSFEGPKRCVQSLHNPCHCVNFLPNISVPVQRFFMPYGITSKDHYSLLEVICDLKLPIEGVASLGILSASELCVIASANQNKRIYSCPLISLTEFSDHTAGSYTPSEFYGSAYADKLLFHNEAVLAQHTLEEGVLLDFSAIAAHLSYNCWNGVIYRLEPRNLLSVSCDAIIRSVSSFAELCGQVLSKDGWSILQLRLPCQHLLECCMSILSTVFYKIRLCVSSYESYPSGYITIVGFNLKLIKQEISITYSLDYYTIFNTEQQGQLSRFLALLKRTNTSAISSLKNSHLSQSLFSTSLENGLDGAMIRYLGNNVLISNGEKVPAIIDSIDQFLDDCLQSNQVVMNYAKRFFNGKPMCSGMVLALSSNDEQGQLNENYYLYIRVQLLQDILRSLNTITMDQIITTMMRKFTIPTDHSVMPCRLPCFSLSHFLSFYAGDLFEILSHLTKGRVARKLYKDFLPDLHYQGKDPPRKKQTKLFQEMIIDSGFGTSYNQDFKWDKKSLLLMILYVKHILSPKGVLVVSNSNVWLMGICEYLNIPHVSLDFNKSTTIDFDTIVIPVDQESINVCLNGGVVRQAQLFFTIERNLVYSLVGLGIESLQRPVFQGINPKGCWVHIKYGTTKVRNVSNGDWSSLSGYWSLGAGTNCRCLDCASSQQILRMSDIYSSSQVINYLASNNDYLEGDFDLYH